MNYHLLANAPLFRGISEEELKTMLDCLGGRTATYEKDAFIYRCGETVENVGMILSGSVIIERDDLWGNRSILGCVEQGKIFAESYACVPGEPLLVNVTAAERTEVLFLNTARVLQVCPNTCAFHHRLVRNLLQISAQDNLRLSRRILYTSPKTVRGRLTIFFSDRVKACGSYTVTVPFNRQQLADYLGIDRSAMCHELSKMQKDGILTYEKNTFHLTTHKDTPMS